MVLDEMYNNDQRSAFFKKDSSLEESLKALNGHIENINIPALNLPEKPIILIMGCPRSGSTLMMQYLAASGLFSYPSNLISRFYNNPYMGILVQQVLLEKDPNNQLDFNLTKDFYQSNLGKTKGALAPSEFWYFWRTFFEQSGINKFDEKTLRQVNQTHFLKKLSAFECLTGKSPVMKGMILNWNIPYLHSIYNRFIFINLTRDIVPNAKSLLNARRSFFNDETKWYSFKPPEFETLRSKTPIEQVVGQVYYTNKAISDGLSQLPSSNIINIAYEEFCKTPSYLIQQISQRFEEFNFHLETNIKSTQSFNINQASHKDSQYNKAFELALQAYE
jgi:hypothetical protein